MDLYGDAPGDPVLLINPADKGRVAAENWGGTPIYTETQKVGKVTFGRGLPVSPFANVEVDEHDPRTVHMGFTCEVQTSMSAKIVKGGLLLTYVKQNKEITDDQANRNNV